MKQRLNKYKFHGLYRIDVPGGIGFTATVNGNGKIEQGVCSEMDFELIKFARKLRKIVTKKEA